MKQLTRKPPLLPSPPSLTKSPGASYDRMDFRCTSNEEFPCRTLLFIHQPRYLGFVSRQAHDFSHHFPRYTALRYGLQLRRKGLLKRRNGDVQPTIVYKANQRFTPA